MRPANTLILVTMMAVLFSAWSVAVPVDGVSPVTDPAPQWAYKVVPFYDLMDEDFTFRERDEEYQQLEAHLNRLGEDGWQLINMDESMLIFKRPQPR